jgi:UDP-glucose 4-epimerase
MSYWNPCGPKVPRGPFSLSMRILITGGLGFVGGRLALHLAQAGHRLVLGSRNAVAPPGWLSQAEVAKINWEDSAALKRCCMGVDIVIQAAGMNAQDCASDPVAALTFNGIATARLVDAASCAGVQRVIYLSTAHVYASRLVGTITEETCPRNLHPYATSHLAGERAVLGASQRGNIQGIVLRLSNVFGTPMNKSVNCWMLLVNDLCRQAVQTHKLILRSGGQEQRDFIAMNEVCRVVERLAVTNGDDSLTGIFNIGAGESQSVLSMAQTIQQRCVQALGFEPELQRKQDVEDIHLMPLIYQTVRRVELGTQLDASNNIAEIDHLLHYCAATFDQTHRHAS